MNVILYPLNDPLTEKKHLEVTICWKKSYFYPKTD